MDQQGTRGCPSLPRSYLRVGTDSPLAYRGGPLSSSAPWLSLPVSSRGGTGHVRSAPSTACALRWWCRSIAAWSRGSSGAPRPQPSGGSSSSKRALPPAWGCTPGPPPPTSFFCPWASAATFPPWSRPSARCWSGSIARRMCSAAAALGPSGRQRMEGGGPGLGPMRRSRAEQRAVAHRLWKDKMEGN